MNNLYFPDSVFTKKRLLFLLPESGIIFIEFFKNGCDDGFPHILGPVVYLVAVKKRVECIQLPIIEHDGIPIGPFQMIFFSLSSPQNQ